MSVKSPENNRRFESDFIRLDITQLTTNLKDIILFQKADISKELLEKLKEYLKNRWRMRITVKDIIALTISKLFCCPRLRKRIFKKTDRKVQLYQKGENKIMKELDCVVLMKRMRQLDLILSLFLSSRQKFLLNFQRKNLIKDYSSSSSDGGGATGGGDLTSSLMKKFREDSTHNQQTQQLES